MSDKHLDAPFESCDGGTSAASRRSFLQLAGCAALSAVALGLSASDASAFAVTMAEGAQSGSERRYPVPAADGVTIDKTGQVIVVRYRRTCTRSTSRARTRTRRSEE